MKYVKPILEDENRKIDWSKMPLLLKYLEGGRHRDDLPAEEWQAVQEIAAQWAELVVDTIGTNLGMLEARPTHQVRLLNIEIVEGNFDNTDYDASELYNPYDFSIDVYACPEFTKVEELDALYPDEKMAECSLIFDVVISTDTDSNGRYIDTDYTDFKLSLIFVGEGDIEVQISDRARKMIQRGMQDLFGTNNWTAVRRMTARTGPR